MNELEELLDRTARSIAVQPAAETVEADLQRGREALARRRRSGTVRFSLAGMAAAIALVGIGIVVTGSGREGKNATPGGDESVAADQQRGEAGAIRLVAYTGEQPEGFVVDEVPSGWSLQGTNATRLTIAPQDDTSSPDDFTGKLVVFLLSASAQQELPNGEPIRVGTYDGVVTDTGPADTLTYEDGAGHLVQVQAWRPALDWTSADLARFAEGVTVTSDAEAGLG